MKTRESDIIKN